MSRSRRTGQIENRRAGVYRIRWYLGEDPGTGKRRYDSETVHGTKRDAEQRLAELTGKLDRGVVVTTRGVLVARMLGDWFADEGAQAHRRARTIRSYRQVSDNHLLPTLGKMRVDRLDAATVKSQLLHPLLRNGKERTADLARNVLSASLRWAAEKKRYGIDSNPLLGMKLDKPKSGGPVSLASHALTTEQVVAFRAAIGDDRYELLLLTMLLTGMRPSEALGLQWRDVALTTEERHRWGGDPDPLAREAARGEGGPCLLVRRVLLGRELWVSGALTFAPPKTRASYRVIPLGPELVARLRPHKLAQQAALQRARGLEHPLVFVGRSAQPVNLVSLRRRHFKAALERAGLPKSIRLYDLRHTAATAAVNLAVKTGAGLTSVSSWLGHASLKETLDTYTHASEAGRRELTAAVEGSLLR